MSDTTQYCPSCESLSKELALTKQKLEATEARWLSERQLNDALQRQLSEANARNARLVVALEDSWTECAPDFDATDMCNDAMQLIAANFKSVAAWEAEKQALAKQPDTRALDKALLEAEIKVLGEAYPFMDGYYEPSWQGMVEERQAKLAELNENTK